MAIISEKMVATGKGFSGEGVSVNLLNQGRAQGLLKKAGILEGHTPPEAHNPHGEVDLYRTAIEMANGFQMPIQYSIKFKPPRGISQPYLDETQPKNKPSSAVGSFGRFGSARPIPRREPTWTTSHPEGYVQPGGLDHASHIMNQSVSGANGKGSGPGTIKYLYDDAAQVAQTMWQVHEKASTYIGMLTENEIPPAIKREDTILNLFCSKVSIPEKSINFVSMRHYGTHFAYPQSVSYGTISTTFYCDASMKIKKFFDAWQKLIFNDITGNFNYYDEYISDFDVYTRSTLFQGKHKSPGGGRFDDNNWIKQGTEKLNEFTGMGGSVGGSKDMKLPVMEFQNTYGVKVMQCWPQIVGAIDLGHASTNSIAEFNVTWAYKKWNTFNLGDIAKTGGEINLHTGTMRDSGDGIPFIQDLPVELSGPITDSADQALLNSPIAGKFNSISG